MFCQFCGYQLSDSVGPCPQCGKAVSASAESNPDLRNQVISSSKDASEALKQMLKDPVGGLSGAYFQLGPNRALGAGIILCIGFALAVGAGVSFGAGEWLSGLYRLTGGTFGSKSTLSGFWKLTVNFSIIPAALSSVGYGIRRIAGATQPFAADVLTAGAALSPLGVTSLVAGFLGVANLEVIVILLFFSFSYLILMLFSGMTRVGGLSESVGVPAVPGLLLLASWLVTVLARALLM